MAVYFLLTSAIVNDVYGGAVRESKLPHYAIPFRMARVSISLLLVGHLWAM